MGNNCLENLQLCTGKSRFDVEMKNLKIIEDRTWNSLSCRKAGRRKVKCFLHALA